MEQDDTQRCSLLDSLSFLLSVEVCSPMSLMRLLDGSSSLLAAGSIPLDDSCDFDRPILSKWNKGQPHRPTLTARHWTNASLFRRLPWFI